MLVAVVYLNAVYALGEYTNEDYPQAQLIPLTQEEFDIVSSYMVPRYENGVFFDGIVLVNIDSEKGQNYVRIDVGQYLHSEFIGSIRIPYLMGTITQETYLARKTVFEPVRNELLAGDFENAKVKLTALGSSVIGTELYNSFMQKIDTLISEYYPNYNITPTQQRSTSKKKL